MSHPLALPKNFSPDALDTSTELASILTRLRPPTNEGGGAAATPAAGAGGAPGGPTSAGGASGMAGATSGADTAAGPAIHLRDFPTATDSLKHKLHHARAQVNLLPDMGRTVAEQTAEIDRLEERLRQQRAVLARLRADGAQFATDQQQREKMQV